MRRTRRWHPDFDSGPTPPPHHGRAWHDAAVDFVDMTSVIDRMHAAFFEKVPCSST